MLAFLDPEVHIHVLPLSMTMTGESEQMFEISL